MKYNLDDLISKSFERKENVSPEFSRSVIDKMQMASGGMGGKNWRLPAAACIGVFLVAGATMLAWKADFGVQKEKQSVKWEKSAAERKVAEVPRGDGKQPEIIQRVPDVDLKESESEGKPLANQEDGGTGKEVTPEPVQSAESVSDKKKEKQAAAEKSLEAEKRRQKRDSRKSREMNISSQNQAVKPLPNATGKPGAAGKPNATEKPSATKKPSATGKPGGSELQVAAKDYTALCSMKCSSPEGENMDSINLAFSSYIEKGLLSNREITSYDQLQELIQKSQNMRRPGNEYVIDWLVRQLEQFDQEYFQENVLYCHNVYLTAGYDFELSSVKLIEEEGGKRLLKIALDYFRPSDMFFADVMCYYCCFIQIPKDAAEACDTIKCSLADGPEWADRLE